MQLKFLFCYHRVVEATILTFEDAKLILSNGSHEKVYFSCPSCAAVTLRQFRTCLKAKRCSECFKQVQIEKRNLPPISVEEAAKTCSPGSKQLVFWKCPDCRIEQVKSYIQALKVKRCKPCNNIIRPKSDFSGENNPMFGISIPQKKGEESQNYENGKPICKDCGNRLQTYTGEYCRKCWQKGERNPGYNHTLTVEERIQQRNTPSHRAWAFAVKERDNFTCQICQKRGQLHSHHLNSYSKFPQERYKIENGITLCKACHWAFHDKYGKHRNTKEQFVQFLAIMV